MMRTSMSAVGVNRMKKIFSCNAFARFHTSIFTEYNKRHNAVEEMVDKPKSSYNKSYIRKNTRPFKANEANIPSIIDGEINRIKFVSQKQRCVLLKYDLIYAVETRDVKRLDSIIFANMDELTFFHISNIFSQLYKSSQENSSSISSLSQNAGAALLDRLDILCEYKQYLESKADVLPFHAAAKVNRAYLPANIQYADEITYLLWGLHSFRSPALQNRLIAIIVDLLSSHKSLLETTMNEKHLFNATFALNRLDPTLTDDNKNIRSLFSILNTRLVALKEKRVSFSLVEVSSMLFACKNFSLKSPELREFVSSVSDLLEKLTLDLTRENNINTKNNDPHNQISDNLDIRVFTNILKGIAQFNKTAVYCKTIKSTARLFKYYCDNKSDEIIDIKNLSICMNCFRNVNIDSLINPKLQECYETNVTAICFSLCYLFEKQETLHNNEVLNLTGIAASFCGLRHLADSMLTKRVGTLMLKKLRLIADGANPGCLDSEKANAYALLLFSFKNRNISTSLVVDVESPSGANKEMLGLLVEMLQRDERVLNMTSKEVGLMLSGIQAMNPKLEYVKQILLFLNRVVEKQNIFFKTEEKQSIGQLFTILKSQRAEEDPVLTQLHKLIFL